MKGEEVIYLSLKKVNLLTQQVVWGSKSTDSDAILASIRYHYYQAGPAITKTQVIVAAITADQTLDQSTGSSLQIVLDDLKVKSFSSIMKFHYFIFVKLGLCQQSSMMSMTGNQLLLLENHY